jgi:hypothetical protein
VQEAKRLPQLVAKIRDNPPMTTVAIHRPVRPSRGVRHTKRRLKGPRTVTVSTIIHTGR